MTPLIVENGVGVPGADSYNSVAELDAYMVKFGHADWPVVEDMPQNGAEMALFSTQSQNMINLSGEEENAPETPPEGDNDDVPESVPTTPITPAEPTIKDPNLERKQAAARKAALYLDAAYGTRFTGTPVNPEQGLLWPRKEATDYFGNAIADDIVPKEIKQAHAEVALLAYKGTALAAQTSSGPLLVRKKIDVLEWEWDVDTYGSKPIFGWVDSLLFRLLGPAEEVGAMDIMGVQRA